MPTLAVLPSAVAQSPSTVSSEQPVIATLVRATTGTPATRIASLSPTVATTVPATRTPTPSPTSTITHTPTTRATTTGRVAVNCVELLQLFGTIKQSVTAKFPANFPSPPPLAQACGVDSPGSTHFASELAPDEVLAYYRDKMTGRSCKEIRQVVIRKDQVAVTWECTDGRVVLVTNPQITEFTLRFMAK